MLYRNLPVFVITLLAVTFFLVGSAHAQFRASLCGTIRDPRMRGSKSEPTFTTCSTRRISTLR